ncbi:MAG TPA: cytochrome c oxidase assembly protein [Pirellulales bacterium]|jgi:cytochrome c oxidase assembly factor CtaG/polyferredoxin|nr:cytochrome c oxidase assembly protein [Pirellulales bacterium]
MSPTLDAILSSWPSARWLWAGAALAAAVYGRGWWGLRRRDPQAWHWGQLAAFMGGLTAILLALASPVDPLAALLLRAHMVQHLLLMMVAPPLLWLGDPLFPCLRGLPRGIRKDWIVPLLRAEGLRQTLAWLTYPPVALVVYVVVTWLGHVPAVYETALRSDGWHVVQHISFLAAGLLFWYPVVRPYPSHPRWSPWLLVPYLVLADVQNTVLAALITFSHSVLYPYYDQVPRLAGVSALDDQAAAGVVMWVPGSVAFLLPLFVLAVHLVGGSGSTQSPKRRLARAAGFVPLPIVGVAKGDSPPRSAGSSSTGTVWGGVAERGKPARPAIDLLRVPVLGQLLVGPVGHWLLPGLLALLAGALVVDGLYGPQTGAMNLAGVLPWIHWRGMAVFVLLAAGNLVCGACPFTLPRRLLGRLMPVGRPWPAWLAGKWLSVGLLALFLWAYEVFALWDRPAWTAWLAIGYFVAAFTVDSLFRDGSFCKHVCPIGQFNFVHSLLSPLEVRVRRPSVCVACQTKDCLHGRGTLPGCSLELLQPAKAGNFDCTFCLACVRACPQDNVGLLVTPPARELWLDRSRSGVGRLGRRVDLAALVVVLVFGALANAGAMVAPVVRWQDGWQAWLGLASPWLLTSVLFVVMLVVVPLASVGLAAVLSCRWARLAARPKELALRFVWSLVPMGFGLWLAHYSFHFFTSFATVVPVAQRFAADWGWNRLGPPRWVCSCCGPVSDWIVRAEILFLDLGLLASLYVAYRIAAAYGETFVRRMRTVIPWAGLVVLIFAAGIWIVLEPMEMRGTMMPAAVMPGTARAGTPLPLAAIEPARPIAAQIGATPPAGEDRR